MGGHSTHLFELHQKLLVPSIENSFLIELERLIQSRQHDRITLLEPAICDHTAACVQPCIQPIMVDMW